MNCKNIFDKGKSTIYLTVNIPPFCILMCYVNWHLTKQYYSRQNRYCYKTTQLVESVEYVSAEQ